MFVRPGACKSQKECKETCKGEEFHWKPTNMITKSQKYVKSSEKHTNFNNKPPMLVQKVKKILWNMQSGRILMTMHQCECKK